MLYAYIVHGDSNLNENDFFSSQWHRHTVLGKRNSHLFTRLNIYHNISSSSNLYMYVHIFSERLTCTFKFLVVFASACVSKKWSIS